MLWEHQTWRADSSQPRTARNLAADQQPSCSASRPASRNWPAAARWPRCYPRLPASHPTWRARLSTLSAWMQPRGPPPWGASARRAVIRVPLAVLQRRLWTALITQEDPWEAPRRHSGAVKSNLCVPPGDRLGQCIIALTCWCDACTDCACQTILIL